MQKKYLYYPKISSLVFVVRPQKNLKTIVMYWVWLLTKKIKQLLIEFLWILIFFESKDRVALKGNFVKRPAALPSLGNRSPSIRLFYKNSIEAQKFNFALNTRYCKTACELIFLGKGSLNEKNHKCQPTISSTKKHTLPSLQNTPTSKTRNTIIKQQQPKVSLNLVALLLALCVQRSLYYYLPYYSPSL